MAQLAQKNFTTIEDHHQDNAEFTRAPTTQYRNSETNTMNLLDTLKYMMNICNKRMQDVTDCRDSHRTKLAAGHAYPADCELERMDRMAVRAKQYWQRIKEVWKHHDAASKCPRENLEEIAVNVTNLGDMVDKLVKASQQYASFYRQTGQRKGDEQTRNVENDENNKQKQDPAEQEDEYRDILYVDAVSLKNRGQVQMAREAKNEENSLMDHTETVQAVDNTPRKERATPQGKAGERQKVALSG